MNSGEILIEVVRNGLVESVHSGHLTILDNKGRSLLTVGEPNSLIYPRSAIKAIQGSAMVRNGLILEDELLALVCASHAGSTRHLENVQRILAIGGLTELALTNTPDKPLGVFERRAWGERSPSSLAANCSGKHAGMVLTSKLNNWDLVSYKDPAHPLQVACRKELEILAGETVQKIGVDGCGAPLFAISLAGLAKAIHEMLISSDPIHMKVVNACRTFPIMVSGEGRLPTIAMQQAVDLFVKDGAEGVMVAGLTTGETIVWKMSDGSQRGASALLSAALKHIGVTQEFEREAVFGGGQVVGEIRPSKLMNYA